MKNLKDITLIILVIIIIFFSLKSPKVTKRDTIVKTDTVYVETIQYDTIWNDSDTIFVTKVLHIPTIKDVVINNDTVSNYLDTLNYDGLLIHYNMFVKGKLVKFELGYADTRPEIIKTVTQTSTITNEVVKYRNGIYLGGEIGGSINSFNISPKITLQRNKWLYSYRYGLTDRSHNISIQHKLF